MVACAPIPPDENARVAALRDYHVLDTQPDEKFDLFAKLGSWLFNVPFSAINLVDAERTFFKSLIGFPSYSPARSTSICAHAVGAGNDLMVIEDLATDERFHDHPLVLGVGARFYAGALLRSESGHALGTLCIAGTQPQGLSLDNQQKLLTLARGVEAVLQLHRNSRHLLQMANQDVLTGLSNRRLFEDRLAGAVALARAGGQCALLYLDLDRFKSVNDRFGHAGGDELLVEVGQRISQAARAEDLVARLAGDEFAVMLLDRSGQSRIALAAERLAERIMASFALPFTIGGTPLHIATSIGVGLCPDHARDEAQLVRCADAALYQAKAAGRSQYRIYQPAFGAEIDR